MVCATSNILTIIAILDILESIIYVFLLRPSPGHPKLMVMTSKSCGHASSSAAEGFCAASIHSYDQSNLVRGESNAQSRQIS